MEIVFESVQIQGDFITPDLLMWRRYRWPVFGAAEMFREVNPHVSEHLMTSPYLPVGEWVLLPVVMDYTDLASTQESVTTRVWGDAVSDPVTV